VSPRATSVDKKMWYAVIILTWNSVVALYYDHDPQSFRTHDACAVTLSGLIDRAEKDEDFGRKLDGDIPDGTQIEVQPKCIDVHPLEFEQKLQDEAAQRRPT
jgi:hypothetical protein